MLSQKCAKGESVAGSPLASGGLLAMPALCDLWMRHPDFSLPVFSYMCVSVQISPFYEDTGHVR